MSTPDLTREMLRHAVATLAYRGAKVARGAPESFASFRVSGDTRAPIDVLAHIGDLLDWALSMAKGKETWPDASPKPWAEEVRRFHDSLGRLDEYLASDAPLACSCERLFQGPIADALTHVGQIALLRRIAGAPIRAENYSRAQISAGRVGADQAAPAREFD